MALNEDDTYYGFRPQKDVPATLVAEMVAQLLLKAQIIFPGAMIEKLPKEEQKHFIKLKVEKRRILKPNGGLA